MASDLKAPVQGNDVTIEVKSDDEFLASLDRRNRLMDRILGYAITSTFPSQWMDIGGKPYPTGPACEAMARRCAVSITDVESEREEREDEMGSFYLWTYRGRFSLPGGRDVIHAEGHCSSRDQFLGSPPPKVGEKAIREEWEVEEGNIRQAAYTNMTNNGITRLLGVRNLSWERLCALLGVEREKFGSVHFDQGGRGGGRGKSSDDVEIKWGTAKGKKLSELSDDDVKFYLGAWKRDLEDASKEKYHSSCKRNIEVAEKLLAGRANKASGVSSDTQNGQTISVWKRVLALDEAKGVGEADLKSVVKDSTKKQNAAELVEADLSTIKAALADWKKKVGHGEDIKF